MKRITGTAGRIVLADLNDRSFRVERIPEQYRRDYLGGKGLALRYFLELRGTDLAEMDPLGGENLLCFFSGVMAGTGAVCSARFAGVTLSPLTGLMVHASCGGPFGIALKTAGYDGLIVSGKADRPVVIELLDPEEGIGRVSDAEELWGLDTEEVQERLLSGKQDGALAIGPAGEHLVRYANIASGHRFLGRGGMGAVMGSKQLKAIVARGGRYEVKPVDERRFAAVKKRSVAYVNRNAFTLAYRKFGTAFNVRPGMKAGFIPVRNFRDRTDERTEAFSGEAMARRYRAKPDTCRPCSILCGHSGTYPDGAVRQIPEYETVGLLGPNLGIWDPDRVARWNETANRLGMDTISLGATLSWAMEAAERGIRPSALAFGAAESIESLLQDIAYRRGEGDELACGTRELSGRYGGADFAIHVKGLELAAYDPRAAWGHGLNYAVANRGGCHLNAFPVGLEAIFGFLAPCSTRAKARWVDYFEDVFSAVNSLQTCQFSAFAYVLEPFVAKYTPRPLLRLAMTWLPRLSRLGLDWSVYSGYFRSITGIPTSAGRLRRCGRRVHILERHMNTIRGVSVEQDTLPARFLREAKTNHPVESVVPIDGMVQAYYRAKGYDRYGIPTSATLRKIGIDPVVPPRVPTISAIGAEHRTPAVRWIEKGYCGILLWFLGRAMAAAWRHDDEIRREVEALPAEFRFALQVSSDGPAMVIGKSSDGTLRFLGGARVLETMQMDLTLRIRSLSAAMLLFTFREGTAVSQARNRMIADGPIPETCTVVRILNRLETIILPLPIARLAVKRYRKPERLGRKRTAVYLGAMIG